MIYSIILITLLLVVTMYNYNICGKHLKINNLFYKYNVSNKISSTVNIPIHLWFLVVSGAPIMILMIMVISFNIFKI
jgi:hypothetical protein